MIKKGLFIAFEGIDGSGKSTQAKRLAKRLEQAGHKVHLTFEPTKSAIGSLIRDVFTGKRTATTELVAGLFVADRLDHIQDEEIGVLEYLKMRYTVITDRYYLSSYAYQGAHVDMDWVIEANRKAAEQLRPDINIFVDVSPEESMKRIEARRDSKELYETIENLEKVRKAYLRAIAKVNDCECIHTVNGEQHEDDVAKDIWQLLGEIG